MLCSTSKPESQFWFESAPTLRFPDTFDWVFPYVQFFKIQWKDNTEKKTKKMTVQSDEKVPLEFCLLLSFPPWKAPLELHSCPPLPTERPVVFTQGSAWSFSAMAVSPMQEVNNLSISSNEYLPLTMFRRTIVRPNVNNTVTKNKSNRKQKLKKKKWGENKGFVVEHFGKI